MGVSQHGPIARSEALESERPELLHSWPADPLRDLPGGTIKLFANALNDDLGQSQHLVKSRT